MLRWIPLCLALFAAQPGFAQTAVPPPPPPMIRDPIPGPFFIYFRGDSAELDPSQRALLKTIATSWNDGDGALVLCSLSPSAALSHPAIRERQFERLKLELTTLGLRKLFRSYGPCPALGREVPEGWAGFVLYGVGAL